MCLTRFHVMPRGGLWLVVKIGDLFKGPYRTKDEAIGAAQLLALLFEPAQVIIHDTTGAVEAVAQYGDH